MRSQHWFLREGTDYYKSDDENFRGAVTTKTNVFSVGEETVPFDRGKVVSAWATFSFSKNGEGESFSRARSSSSQSGILVEFSVAILQFSFAGLPLSHKAKADKSDSWNDLNARQIEHQKPHLPVWSGVSEV